MDTIHLDDEDYNRLMDAIVEDTGGDVQAVIDAIVRFGLDRPGVGRCPSLDEPPPP